MKTTQDNTLFTYRRILDFLDQNASDVPDVANSGALKDFRNDVSTLSGHAATQALSTAAAKGATNKHSSLRTILMRDHMAPIARIASARIPATPELVALRMPRGTPKVEQLTAAATAMGQQAAPFADVFIAAGLPADFVAQLTTAANALNAPLSSRSMSRSTLTGATNGMKTTISNAHKNLKILDAFVRTALQNNTTLLASWNQIKHVVKVHVNSKPGTPTAPVTPTTAAPAAPAPATPAPATPATPVASAPSPAPTPTEPATPPAAA
jgi:hypothetical protein